MEISNIAVDQFVAGKIRYYRQRAGFTLSHMAVLLEDISFQQLQKYESGANRVSSSRLFQIARILSVPVANFFPKALMLKHENLSMSEEKDLQQLLQDNPHSKEIYHLVLTLMQVDDVDKRGKIVSLCQNIMTNFVEFDEDD